jgi:hypothetical protein
MGLRDTTQIAQPAGTTVSLPTGYPESPEKLTRAFPDFLPYHRETERIYKLTREAFRNAHEDLALPINKLNKDALTLYASADNLTALISTEASARVNGDAAIATTVTTLSSTVSSNYTTLEAMVTAEATTRATKDGYVESTYTLTAAAGHVTTGMRLIAASGVTDVSAVIFQADVFKIYNGTSGVAAFTLSGGNLSLAGSITLLNTQVDGLGDLATEDSVAYGDITGTKPPSNADVTLSAIVGGLSLTGGGLILASGGAAIRGGMTAYDTGSGFWLGDVSGTTKFSIGNSAGNKMTWDGSALAVTGTLSSTSGTIGGLTLAASSLSAVGSLGSVTISAATGSVSVASGISQGTFFAYDPGVPGSEATLELTRGLRELYATCSAGGAYIRFRDAAGAVTVTLDGDGGVVAATSFSGSGASLTSLSASNISSGTLNSARMPASFGGTFTGTFSGSVDAGAISGSNINISSGYYISGTKVLGAQGALIANAGTSNVVDATYNDTQLNTLFNAFGSKINEILARLRAHGAIAT